MPDHFEEIFADLRAATLPQVRPPGIDAARRTTRRRRRTTHTVAAAAVALAVTGGLAATGLPWRGGHGGEPTERRGDLVDTARRAIDVQLPNLTGQPVSGMVTSDGKFDFPDQPAGLYTLALACAGPGVVTVEAGMVRAGKEPGVLGGQVVSCAAAPQVAVMVFRLSVKGSVVVTAAGDTAATGNAGFTLKLGDDRTGDTPGRDTLPGPESAWNAARAADVLKAHGRPGSYQVTTEDSATQFIGPEMRAQPGDYDLWLVCAGPGSLRLTVRTVSVVDGLPAGSGPTVSDSQVECLDIDPRLEQAQTFTLPAASTFMVTALPDQQAQNRAGWAYELVRR